MSKKLNGKAKQKARAKAAKLKSASFSKVMNLVSKDPNAIDYSNKMKAIHMFQQENSDALVVNHTWKHLTPTSVEVNDAGFYSAIYTDNYGSYPFQLLKKATDKYDVIVENVKCYTNITKSKVEYEFECQVADYDIECLAA